MRWHRRLLSTVAVQRIAVNAVTNNGVILALLLILRYVALEVRPFPHSFTFLWKRCVNKCRCQVDEISRNLVNSHFRLTLSVTTNLFEFSTISDQLFPFLINVAIIWKIPASTSPCELPVAEGEGNETVIRWFADGSDRSCTPQCKMFTYKGFKGNQNNFLTKKECEEQCKRTYFGIFGKLKIQKIRPFLFI